MYYYGRYLSFVERVILLFNFFLLVEPIHDCMRYSAMDFCAGPYGCSNFKNKYLSTKIYMLYDYVESMEFVEILFQYFNY
jgi:hypothetical protein